MSSIVKIEAEFDLDDLREQINASLKITGDEPYFEQLTKIQAAKQQLKAVEDELIGVESEAKNLINSKAKALYGDNWTVVKGEHFKINRSKTGDLYLITGSPAPKFIKVKKSVDSKAVEEYVAAHSKLPKGLEINDQRGESIRIVIND